MISIVNDGTLQSRMLLLAAAWFHVSQLKERELNSTMKRLMHLPLGVLCFPFGTANNEADLRTKIGALHKSEAMNFAATASGSGLILSLRMRCICLSWCIKQVVFGETSNRLTTESVTCCRTKSATRRLFLNKTEPRSLDHLRTLQARFINRCSRSQSEAS